MSIYNQNTFIETEKSLINPKFQITKAGTLTGNAIQLNNNDLVTTCDSLIKIWDWNTKTIRYEFTGNSGQVWGFVELPNGYLVSTGLDMKIIVWK